MFSVNLHQVKSDLAALIHTRCAAVLFLFICNRFFLVLLNKLIIFESLNKTVKTTQLIKEPAVSYSDCYILGLNSSMQDSGLFFQSELFRPDNS